jgi:peptidoglycan hydrolase CwlO-like protein
MSKVKKFVSVVSVAAFSFSLLTATGCSRHPNEEQISAMEEARSACLAAEQKLNEVQNERASLQGQLDSKKADLTAAQEEKATVQQRLENWNPEE